MSFVNFQPTADLLSASQQLLKDLAKGKNLTISSQKLAKAVTIAKKEIAHAKSFSAAIEAAKSRYVDSSEDIEIDDMPLISETDDGTWVSAWVWIPKESIS